MSTVEVFKEGQAWVKDGVERIVAQARISPADLLAFDQLLVDPAVLAGTPDCGRPEGADLPAIELVVQQEWKTVVFKVASHCRLPEPLARLRAMLDEVERKYLSRGR